MALARNTKRTICAAILVVLGFAIPANSQASIVRFTTALGSFDVDMFENQTPQTVANFLVYLNSGAYTDTFIHRSVPGFIVQGGGFTFNNGVAAVPANPPVVNEPGISNLRGTIAMAKLAGLPDSATSQWFFNLDDNSANLDNQNGGFTVFGEVLGDGLTILDQIAGLSRVDATGGDPNSPFGTVPVFDPTAALDENNLVLFESIVVVPEPSCLSLLLLSGSFLACRRRRL